MHHVQHRCPLPGWSPQEFGHSPMALMAPCRGHRHGSGARAPREFQTTSSLWFGGSARWSPHVLDLDPDISFEPTCFPGIEVCLIFLVLGRLKTIWEAGRWRCRCWIKVTTPLVTPGPVMTPALSRARFFSARSSDSYSNRRNRNLCCTELASFETGYESSPMLSLHRNPPQTVTLTLTSPQPGP